jgi:MoaA/NifB/PqqE/SkfB family radical SAM enzyme
LEKENGNDLPDGAGTAWLYVEPDGDVLKAQDHRGIGQYLSDPWEKIWNNPQRHA